MAFNVTETCAATQDRQAAADGPAVAMVFEGEGMDREGHKLTEAIHAELGGSRADLCRVADISELDKWFPQGVVQWQAASDVWVHEPANPPAEPPCEPPAANELAEDDEIMEEIEVDGEQDDGKFYEQDEEDEEYYKSPAKAKAAADDGAKAEEPRALDRRQYGILLGVAFSLFYDGAIDKQQRGLLKDLILCDDGRMLVAMDAHDWLVEHEQVDEGSQFEQLMEVLYNIAHGIDDEGSTGSDSDDDNDDDDTDDDMDDEDYTEI